MLYCFQVFKLGPTESICVCQGSETDKEVWNYVNVVVLIFVVHICVLYGM